MSLDGHVGLITCHPVWVRNCLSIVCQFASLLVKMARLQIIDQLKTTGGALFPRLGKGSWLVSIIGESRHALVATTARSMRGCGAFSASLIR